MCLMTWMPLNTTIVAAAATTFTTLPTSIFLRASDCIHLVTAIHHNSSCSRRRSGALP